MNELKKWILNNIDMKILALIMAIILWFYISSEYNISAERYYDIEVFPVNLRPDLSIKDIRNQVSVGIEGPKNILENTSAQKISGTVDLSNIVDPGEYYVNVKTALPKNTELVKIIPNEVRINIEKITEKNIVVGYNLIGLPERGFSLEDEPTISPIDVKVIGPESALNKISKAIIDIDISSIKDDFFSEEEIIIYNESNEIVKNLQIEPKKVIASIKVGEGYPEKFLSIKPRIVGKPAPDYFITNIEANPSEIEVYGNYSKIANVDFL
ncbi:MAG: CdaR family protein, partial [Atribacterota bacterium]|nr:CdaR family protein [Atribacterota bacterium]